MTIKVLNQNGASIEFPDGTDEQTIAKVMRGLDGGAQPPQTTVPQKPPMSLGETTADVAKSAGIGLVQGGIGLATLPGNLEALGRAGVNYAAGMAGIEPPVSGETVLPNYNDWKKRVEGVTGEFYEPKSTAGEYARTVGEFAPMAIGGGGAVAAASRVLAPAVASETAGQLTKGTSYEPAARVAGALIGGRIPAPGSAPRVARNPQHAQAVNRLEQEGVNALTAAQRTGSAPMRWVEDATVTVPGGGGRALAMQEQAAEQFTAAALRRAGVQANRVTTDVLNQAFANIGREYNLLGQSNNITVTPRIVNQFNHVARTYERLTPDAMRVPLVREIADEISQTAMLAGDRYNAYRSALRRAQRGLKGNPQASEAVGNLVNALDRALVSSTPAGQRQQVLAGIRDMNTRYRNLLAIEDAAGAAGEAASTGLISPSALKNAVKKQNKRDYTRGRSELGQLARAGETVMRPLKSSGTAERTMAQGYVSTPGAVIGGLGSGSIEGAIAGTVLPWAAKAATSRAIMSRPGQFMIGRQGPANFDLRMPDQNSRVMGSVLAAEGMPERRAEEERRRALAERLLINAP